MMGAPQPATSREGATFELDEMDTTDGLVTIRGRWAGVRGMRFVRPALVVDGRQILAVLDHKPWAAPEDDTWIAAFPWDGDEAPDGQVRLAVAPSVVVPLAGGAAVDEVEAEPEPATVQPGTPGREEPEPDRLAAALAQIAQLESQQTELRREKLAAELARDRARAQLDESVRDREAALRTRERALADAERATQERDEARDHHAAAERARMTTDEARKAAETRATAAERARKTAEVAVKKAEAARDDAEVRRVAAETQSLRLARANRDLHRALDGTAPDLVEEAAGPVAPGVLVADDEEPLGIRPIPMPPVRAPRAADRALTVVEFWAIRVFAVVAGVSLLLLIITMIGAFW